MKKTMFITLSILIAVSFLAFAGCRHGFGPGCSGPGGISAMIDKEVKDLNLTPAQKATLDGIKTSIEKDMLAHRESMQAMHSDVNKALAKDNPDVNAIAADIKQKLSADANPGVKMVDYFTQFYNTLDANQQKKLIEKVKAWSKDFPGRCMGDHKGCFKTGKCASAKKGCPMTGK
jgi:Spy/CpxP family protein refolding chaperone